MSFEELIHQCEDRIFRIARTIATHDQSGAESVQEAFHNAFGNSSHDHDEERFARELLLVGIDRAVTKFRSFPTTIETGGFSGATLHSGPKMHNWDGALPAGLCGFSEIFRDCLQRLSWSLLIVFLLRDVKELAIEQIGRLLEINVVNVKLRLLRAHGARQACGIHAKPCLGVGHYKAD
jgi:DNA-directed RNA polymerase specialized sigma24 family protein